MPYSNDQIGALVGQLMGEADATLLGRVTYDEFAEYWPHADPDDDMTKRMNSGRSSSSHPRCSSRHFGRFTPQP